MPRVKSPERKRDDAIKVEVNIMRRKMTKLKEKLSLVEKLTEKKRLEK